MDKQLSDGLRIGNFVVLPAKKIIHGADGDRLVSRDCMNILLLLAEREHKSLSYTTLAEAVGIDEESARESVGLLKAALGDAGTDTRFIVQSDDGAMLIAPVLAGVGDYLADTNEEDRELSFFEELKRRKVIRVGAAYIVLAWLAIQVADVILPALGLPSWTVKLTVAVTMLGFPVAIVIAWLFEVTPGGATRDERHQPAPLTRRQRVTDAIIVSCLALVVGYFAFNVLLGVREERDTASLNLAPTMVTAASNTVAVLPFLQSGGADVDFIGDGIAAETLRLLSRLRELKVAASTASFYFKGKNVDPQTIAQKLQVRHLLTGRVQISGDSIRINVELLDATTNYSLWSEVYDRKMDNIFELQSEIARAVAEASTGVLSEESDAKLDARPTSNRDAYVFYLRGRDYLRQPRTSDVLDSAQRVFLRALALDPGYALAYAGLCETHLAAYIRSRSVATVDDAETACQSALEIDPTLAEVHSALGHLYWNTGEFEQAERRFREAIRINPTFYDAYAGLSDTLYSQKRIDEAGLMLQQLIELQPGYWHAHYKMGHYYYRLGEDLKALPYFQQVTDLTPDNAPGWNNLGAVSYMLGDLETAATAWQRAIEIEPTQSMYANLGTMYYYLERFEDAVEMQKMALELAPNDYRMWGRMGAAYLQMGGRDVEAGAAYSRAIGFAEEILTINPVEPDALKNIALFYARTGDTERARVAIEKALELTESDPDTHFFAALTYLSLGDSDRSMNELELAVENGYPLTLIENEHALAPLVETERFRVLISSTKT